MRGRGDGRFQSRGGGRGRYGRGQGEPHKPIVKGRKPEVGAYLDLPRGQAADPEAVLKWLECLRVSMYSTYESSVKEIIGIDGVLTDYEEFVEPDDPPDNAGMVAIERWKTASKKYAANIELHKKDCAKLYGVILGQMSEASITRVNEMPAGKRAIEDCDPLEVLTCVVATHMNNKRYGDVYNMTTAIRNFYNNKMFQNEDLAAYFSRCRTLLFVKSESYRIADEEEPFHTDEFHAVLFVTGLNSNYLEYINTFKNKVRSWPQTMADANQDAANFLMGRPVHGGAPPNSEKRNVFAASRGGRAGSAGRGGRGRGSGESGAEKGGFDTPGSESSRRAGTPYRDREATPQRERGGAVQEYGTRYGACNNCGEEGHYAYECKKPPRKNAPARHPSSEK